MHTLDITVYSLNVMKIQYTEQQYNALEIVQYIHNRSYALLRRMTMNWKVVPFLFFFSSPPPNNMQICLDLLWPFQNSHVRNPKLIQNFQSHLMCTHTHTRNIYLVTSLFVLNSICFAADQFWDPCTILNRVIIKQCLSGNHLTNKRTTSCFLSVIYHQSYVES